MTNPLGFALLAFFAMALVGTGAYYPPLLSNENEFLREFVNHEYLNILGVIVAITAASAANIHLELRRLEGAYNFKNGFENTRREVKRAAYALVYLFCAGALVVFIKPALPAIWQFQVIMNALALWILFWNILILLALLRLSFTVGPIDLDEDDSQS